MTTLINMSTASRVLALITDGVRSRTDICNALGINRKHLNTIFSRMRQRDMYVVQTPPGLLRVVSRAAWERIQDESRATKAATLVTRCSDRVDQCITRLTVLENLRDGLTATGAPTDEIALRIRRGQVNLDLAQFQLTEALDSAQLQLTEANRRALSGRTSS